MDNIERFMALFSGLNTAYGTGAGGWVKRELTHWDVRQHLAGEGVGIGVAPLREDGTVLFAAIDLDEPDFATAKVLSELLPGKTFIERSRSGNAHVWAFFSAPIEAWIPRGIMREACAAVNKRFVEVFPKQDKLRLGMVGNYINAPYFGDTRPIMSADHPEYPDERSWYSLPMFLSTAEAHRNNPKDWIKRASWLGIPSPNEKAAVGGREFGTSSFLHQCAEWVIQNRDENPVVDGHRAVVYFALSKQLANCNQFDDDECLAMLGLVNDSSPDPIPEHEIRTIYTNAKRGQFTSTGCDDPLFAPYAHPECPIAHGRVG